MNKGESGLPIPEESEYDLPASPVPLPEKSDMADGGASPAGTLEQRNGAINEVEDGLPTAKESENALPASPVPPPEKSEVIDVDVGPVATSGQGNGKTSEEEHGLPAQKELEDVLLAGPVRPPEESGTSDVGASPATKSDQHLKAAERPETRLPAEDRIGKQRPVFGIPIELWQVIGSIAAVIAVIITLIKWPLLQYSFRPDSSRVPSPTAAGPTIAPAPTPTLTPTLIPTQTPTPSPTPLVIVSVERLCVYAGPGENYELWGEVRRGDQLPLYGRSADGRWWQIDYLGRKGWIRTQAVGANVESDALPVVPTPHVPTVTPTPTATPSLPEPNAVVPLRNPGFEGIQEGLIPGWDWWAEDNLLPGGEYDSGTSLDTPVFSQAKDPVRMIDGPTLQVEARAFVNFSVYIFQVVSVVPTTTVRFQASAQAYSSEYRIRLKAGIDPNGGPDCSQAEWSDTLATDQSDGIVQLATPKVTVGNAGRVTVCLHAESIYPAHCNAAYFDKAALIANPQ
jgi:hypothetical protein